MFKSFFSKSTVFSFFVFSSCLNAYEFAGTYVDERGKALDAYRELLLHPKSGKDYQFSLSVNRGAPSYNSGQLVGELTFEGNRAVFQNNDYAWEDKGCKWEITMSNDVAKITSIDASTYCGLGANVYVDGIYKLISRKIPTHYVNGLGERIPFK